MAAKTTNKNTEKQAKQLRNDLNSTVEELTNLYEEISMLYHLSETLTGLTIDQTCNALLEEIQEMLEVETAAIILVDEERNEAYTAVSTGIWSPNQVFSKGKNIIWDAIENNKPQVYSNINNSLYKNSFPKLKSILVSPLIGKKGAVGAIVAGEKTSGDEFFSYDIKFSMAIASQAALAIENATLHQELENFFFGTVMAFVKAIESRSNWTSGHSERVTRYSLAIAKEMGMDKYFIERLRICGLLHDIGKIATPVEILDKRGKLTKDEKLEVQQHTLTGTVILDGLKPFKDIIEGIKYHHENWDGTGGPEKLKGKSIPFMARILSVSDAFDAMTSDRPYRKKMSLDTAVKEIADNSGKQFDPEIVKIFLKIKDSLLPQAFYD